MTFGKKSAVWLVLLAMSLQVMSNPWQGFTQEPYDPPVEEPYEPPVEEPVGDPPPMPPPGPPASFIAYMVGSASLTMTAADKGVVIGSGFGKVKNMPDLNAALYANDRSKAAAADLKELQTKNFPMNPAVVDINLFGIAVIHAIGVHADGASGVEVGVLAVETAPPPLILNPYVVTLMVPKVEKIVLNVESDPWLFEGDRVGLYVENPAAVKAIVELQLWDGWVAAPDPDATDEEFEEYYDSLWTTVATKEVGPTTTKWEVIGITNSAFPFNDSLRICAKILLEGQAIGDERVSNEIIIQTPYKPPVLET